MTYHELPLREYLENIRKLAYLHRRVWYNEKLRVQLETSAGFNGATHVTQNDLADSISIVIMNELKELLKYTVFLSTIEDEVVNIRRLFCSIMCRDPTKKTKNGALNNI
jgi:hypothetical protein